MTEVWRKAIEGYELSGGLTQEEYRVPRMERAIREFLVTDDGKTALRLLSTSNVRSLFFTIAKPHQQVGYDWVYMIQPYHAEALFRTRNFSQEPAWEVVQLEGGYHSMHKDENRALGRNWKYEPEKKMIQPEDALDEIISLLNEIAARAPKP